MPVYDSKIIDDLISNPVIGAGNFFTVLSDYEKNHSKEVILLDEPVVLPGGEETLSLTLGDILLWSNSVSAWYEQEGVAVKDPVGLYFGDTIDYFIHYLALTYIGAIPVLVNGKLTEDIAARFLINVGAVMVSGTEDKCRMLKPIFKVLDCNIKQSPFDSLCLVAAKAQRQYQHQDNDPVLLGHTSGTTGIPKAVQFNHYGFFFGVKQQIKKQVGERVLSALPHSHASAISIMMSYLLRGALLKVQTSKNPLDIFSSFSSFKPDMFVSFPKVHVDMCRYDLNQYDLSSISYWLSTGDANHEPHIRKLVSQGSYSYKGKEFKGSVFIDNLGSSEFGFAAFRNVYFPSSDSYNRRIGLPFDWVEAAVLDENGSAKKDYEVGYLGVKSPSVTAGYWNNSLLSEKNRLAGFWLTGDLVYQDSDGVFFHVDRTTDPISTKQGVLYSCQTEEIILKNFPEIFDCSLVGLDDLNGFQRPVLSIEINPGVDTHQLLDRINNLLVRTNKPEISEIKFDSANENVGATGKKLKRVMRELLDVAV